MNLLFRLLLYLYPASWRAEYGEQMRLVFASRLRDSHSVVSAFLLSLETIPDLLVNAIAVQADVLGQDLRQSIRSLFRAPAFTASAIGIAALGIGATTAAFSMVNHVFFHPLPYANQDRLVQMREDDTKGLGRFWDTSPANYRDWKSMSSSFDSMGAYRGISISLSSVRNDPQRLDGASITHEVLSTLGVTPLLGRAFTASDDLESSPPTVILSYALWRDKFGGDTSVLGSIIKLDDVPYTVIGVMSSNFYFPDRTAQLWTPMRWGAEDFSDRRNTYIFPVACMKAGVSLQQAASEMKTIATRLSHAYPAELAAVSIYLSSFRDLMPKHTKSMLNVLLAASLCVLLIACLNLANLLLARAMLRRRELAVRSALGAGSERLMRQVLTESVVLSLPGGAVGLLLAYFALPWLVHLVPVALPLAEVPTLDTHVLVFACLITLATGIGFGVIPAIRSRSAKETDLHQGGRSGMGARREQLRTSLVIIEIAFSLVLLVGFGLLARTLWSLERVNPGFVPDHVLTLRTQLPMPRYERPETREPFYRSVLENARRIPGVSSAAYTSFLPMVMGGGIWPVEIEGHPETVSSRRTASLRFVTPGFFATMNIPFVTGRDVRQNDAPASTYVAIVSQSFATRYWQGENPVGRHIDIGNHSRQIIGVVGDIRNRGPEKLSEPQVYVAWQQADGVSVWYAPKDLVVRTKGDPAALVSSLRHIIHTADPAQAISDIQTLAEVVEAQTASRNVELAALGIFGSIALLLAAVGIYALLAFAVSTRTQEIGVRMALGAERSHLIGMTLKEGSRLAAIGICLGVPLAYASGRLLQSLLVGVKPWDPAVFMTAIATALAITFAGSILPALRAARVDPISAIRSE